MSYCRWSSDNFACDVYCYESVYGCFTTHVAGNRITSVLPLPPAWDLLQTDPAEWERQRKAHSDAMDKAVRAPIGLPHDGQSFDDSDIESFLARLLSLKAIGYNVPDWVIESVRAEMAEAKGEA